MITNRLYSLSGSTGLLLLCEIAAKPFHEETYANYNADQTCKANKKLYMFPTSSGCHSCLTSCHTIGVQKASEGLHPSSGKMQE